MGPLAAILLRDMRIAVRVGGGALMGVLFFLVVVTLTPFALGPDLAVDCPDACNQILRRSRLPTRAIRMPRLNGFGK